MENIITKLQENTKTLTDVIAEGISDLQHKPHAKISDQKNALKDQVEAYLLQHYKKITDGAKAIGKAFDSVAKLHAHQKEVQTALIYVLEKISAEKDLEKFAVKGFEKGKDSLAKIFGISDEVLGYMYQAAKHFFDHKDFATSANAFSFLTILDPSVHDFWMGLAGSEALNNHPTEAIISFGMAACTNPNSPLPHLYAAECYENIQDFPMANDAIDYAHKLAQEHKEYKHLLGGISDRRAALKRK